MKVLPMFAAHFVGTFFVPHYSQILFYGDPLLGLDDEFHVNAFHFSLLG